MVVEIILLLIAVLILLILFVSFHIMLVADKKGEQSYYKLIVKWLFLSYTVSKGRISGSDDLARGEIIGEMPENVIVCKVREGTPTEIRNLSRDDRDEIIGAETKKKPAEEAMIGLEEEKEGENKWTFGKVVHLARMLFHPILQLVEDVLKKIHISEIKCNLLYGFDNPADTGIVSGYVYALRGYLHAQYDRIRLYAEPTFVEEKMDVHMLADISFRIASLVPAVMTFLLNRDVRRISWALIRKKDLPE
ncbi:DUF2953 domain-containing protein [Methanolobus chelungpuianus]|uniref:DUF2953 domain-containing protein n=1 Tax=Methanolobus chelungpuianus TaxID=502115 RepID=A0AAE3H9M6_9EURY|nr:DUF2953 domain-containing protein [Methanolobus chelungpuianus]MCQ6962490.1 hypothetical protein [Methanolobus chelungpuianus]